MNTIVTGSDKKLVAFYASYAAILGLEVESFPNIAVGIKQAFIRHESVNLIMVLSSKEDYMEYSKLRIYLDETKKNIIIIYTNEVLLKLVTSSRIITFSHKDITRFFAHSMERIHVCKPYMKEKEQEKTPKKVLEHIKFLLTKGNIILPVKNDIAVNVLAALDNDEVSFKKIDSMTKTDPVLHSCLLKMANSVYFSSSYGQIDNIEKALVRVGIVNVKVFLINFINKSLATNTDLLFSKEIDRAIDNSLKTASLCYVLCEYFNIESQEAMFSTGLLSRIGEILIFAAISGFLDDEDITENDMNDYKSIADKNFHTVSGMMLKKWKFIPVYYQPILHSSTLSSNEHMEETKLLHLAENMLSYLDNQKLSKPLKDAMIVTGQNFDKDELAKISARAKTHLKTITSVVL